METWAASRPEFAKALAAKKELDRLAAERARDHGTRLRVRPDSRRFARVAACDRNWCGWPAEREKPDAERTPGFQQRDMARLRAAIERDQKSFFRPADEVMLRSWLGIFRKEAQATQQGVSRCLRAYTTARV